MKLAKRILSSFLSFALAVTALSTQIYADDTQPIDETLGEGLEYVEEEKNEAGIVSAAQIEGAINWAYEAQQGLHLRDGMYSYNWWCLAFVADAYSSVGVNDSGISTAAEAANLYNGYLRKDYNAPRGAFVFYDWSDSGHVAISLGNNQIIHAYGNNGIVVTSIQTPANFRGWCWWGERLGYTYESASPSQNSVGYLDSVWSSPGKLHVSGWAYDPDDPSQNLEIHVYIGGRAGSDTVVASKNGIIANTSRPDVNEAFGIRGNHGYDATFDVPVVGTYPVYVYAIDLQGINNPEIGSSDGIVFEDPNQAYVPDPVFYPIPNGVYSIKNVSSGLYMDVWGAVDDNSTHVNTYESNGTVAQKFRLYHENNGAYWIYAMCSSDGQNRVLDINIGDDLSLGYGDYLDLWTRDPKYQYCQLFNIVEIGNNQYVFELESTPNAVLGSTANENNAEIQLQKYTGPDTQKWIICSPGKDISNCTVENIPDQTYNAWKIEPAVTVKDGAKTLVNGTDYTVTYPNAINVGGYTLTITGIGNYTGSVNKTFYITPRSINSGVILNGITDQTYAGLQINPPIVLTFNNYTLVENIDYTLNRGEAINIGMPSITITGKGNFNDERTAAFIINPKNINSCTVTVSDQTYTGSKIEPAVTVKDGAKELTNGTEYTVAYSDNINVGTAIVTITGIGNYTGTLNGTFKINPNENLGHVMSEAEGAGRTIPDGDYWIRSSMADNYFFDIPGDELITEGGINPQMWIWENAFPSVYDVWTVTYLGNGFYSLKQKDSNMYLDVTNASIWNDADIQLCAENGSIAQQWSIEPQNGGYVLKARCNGFVIDVAAGALESRTPVHTYSEHDGANQIFTFIPCINVNSLTIDEIPDQVYTGEQINPEVVVRYDNLVLQENTDYTLYRSPAVNIGTPEVIVTGKGQYIGSVHKTFNILPKDISGLTVSAIPDQTYTGKEITPVVTVVYGTKTLTKDTDYTVSYSDNINAGTAAVTITGIGNYTGTITGTFKIVKPEPVSTKIVVTATPGIEQATLTWDEVAGATKYAAYIVNDDGTLKALATTLADTTYTAKNLVSGQTYRFLVRAYVNSKWTKYTEDDFVSCTLPVTKPVVTAKAGDSEVMLTWTAVDGATKYAAYCVDPSGTAKCLSSKLTVLTCKAKNLINGETYKFYVRAYVNGAWSKVTDADKVECTPVSIKPVPSAEPADKQVTLTWDAIDGATKYAVYRLQEDGTLKALATKLTDTEYTVKKLVNHTEYSFLVRAYVNSKWTKYDESDYVACTPAAWKPLVRASEYDSMVTLRWGAVDNATKYAAYIVNDDDSLTCVSSKITNIKYTIKNLTNDKEYRFLVRAYVDGKWTKYTERDIISATPHA